MKKNKKKAQNGESLIPEWFNSPYKGDLKSFSPKVDVKKKEGQSKKIEQQKKVEKILSKQKTIGPTKQFISHHLEKKHEEDRLKKLEEYAATHPEVEVSPYGNLTTSSYGEFIQKYGKNLDKFASSLETPMVIQGAGDLLYGVGKLGARYLPEVGEYLTTQTPLKNTYKYNPWAFKPNSEAYYRRIGGNEGLDDLLTSGEVRASQIHHTKNLQGINLAKAHTEPYFSIGVPFDTRYGPKNQFYKGPYTLELKNHPMTGKVNGKLARKANIGVPLEPVYLDNPNLKIYKEHWLKGYKEVPKPKSNSFKSEIDWSKWNPETPSYPELINEYNAIEESTKKAGTWMKNPDGSYFQGIPEQFVQQQSSWFKKAFPNPVTDEFGNVAFNYHGSPTKLNGGMFDEKKAKGVMYGKGIYTSPSKEVAAQYLQNNPEGHLYELYINSNNPQNKITLKDFRDYKNNIEELAAKYKNTTDPTIKDNIYAQIKRSEKEWSIKYTEDLKNQQLEPGFDFLRFGDNQVIPFSNYPKSSKGNVGFFDMSNPNIYKGIIPPVAVGAAVSQGSSEKEKLNYGGVIKTDNMKKARKRKAQMGYTDKTGKKFIVPKQQEMLEDDIPTIQLSDEEIAATSGKKHVNNLASDWDNSGYLAERNGFRPNNLSEILASGLMAVNYMLPEERTKWPVVRPQLSYNPYSQGTGSQAIAKHGITISETGYKRNSKDKNKSKLRIPSNMITMEDVDFPVLGTSDNGITKIMYPGENHVFPGANFVDEERVVAKNGYIIPDISKNRKKFKHGGEIEPLTDDVVQFNGPSHADGGIDIEFDNKQVEVEGGETGYLSPIDNSFNVMGNMINPITGKKFKQDSKILAKKEQKVDKLLDYSLDLVQNSNPRDKWDLLKFNSGAAQLQGAYKKKQQIQESKEHLSNIQKAMLDFANENGGDPIEFSKGGIIFPKKKQILGKAQSGINLGKTENLNERFLKAFEKLMLEAPDFVKNEGFNIFSGYRDSKKQKELFEKSDRSGKWVAAPGKSEHEYGIAGDLQDKSGKRIGKNKTEALKWLHENAEKYGLQFRMKHEPWHISLKPDEGTSNWVGEFRPENYDSDPNNNILVKRGKNQFKINRNAKSQLEELTDIEEAMEMPNFKIKNKPKDFGDYEYNPQKVGRSNYNLELTNPDRIQNDSYLRDLSFEQIAPELLVASTNKPEPVFMQEYTPDLYQPYNVSFQDQLNENTATFKPLMKYNAKNPAVLATLAGEAYQRGQSALANEFRTNQGIEADIVNKNIALLNDAELKNLQLADTQYVRQDKARSNTRIQNIGILQSISDKLVQNEAEKRNFQVMKNLFPYYSFDKNYNVNFGGPSAGEMLTPISMDGTTQQNATVIKSNDNKGYKKETTVVKPTVNQQMDQLNLDRRKLQNVQWIADMLRGPRNRFGN